MFEKIKKGLSSAYYVMRQEFAYVFKDQGVIIFFIALPLAYPLLYTFIYNNETVHEVPIVVVDNNQSARSREFIRLIDASPEVNVTHMAEGIDEAKKYVYEKKAYGIVYIPFDFDSRIVHREQTNVSLFADMSSLLFYKAMLITLTDVSLDMGDKIQIHNLGDLTRRQQETTAMPIKNTAVAMYNPQSGFASFLIPAILMIIIQQTLLLGVGMLAGTARDKNKFKDLIPVNRHYRTAMPIITGKALCYFVIYMVMSAYMLVCVPRFFSLPQIGAFVDIALFMLPYLFACIFFAMILSVIIPGRESPLVIFVFTSIPILFLSGVSWPWSNIPEFWKWVAWIFPSTHGAQGFIMMNSMGARLSEVWVQYLTLWLQAVIYLVIAIYAYRWQVAKNRRQRIEKVHELRRKRRSSGNE